MLEERIPEFLHHLREARYCDATIARAGVVARRFLAYATGRLSRAEELGPEHVQAWLALRARSFRAQHGRALGAGWRAVLVGCLGLLGRYLALQELCPRLARPKRRSLSAVPGHERVLLDYEAFLHRHRGLAGSTIESYLDHAARLCRACGPVPPASWDSLSPALLYDHLLTQARGRSPRTLQLVYCALRSFFRFLRLTGLCARRLEGYLVQARVAPRSRIPESLSTDELYRVAEAVQGASPRRLLNRAVVLLLMAYGLRVGEVARLRLEDVRWRAQELVLRRRKGGRDLRLPLLPFVAEALAAYVLRGRPSGTPYREVFLCRTAPHPYLRGSNVARGVTRQLRRAGIRLRLHALRHTLATRLLNADCPPAWIQQLLGHASIDSTRHYAKADLAHLSEVAQNDVLER